MSQEPTQTPPEGDLPEHLTCPLCGGDLGDVQLPCPCPHCGIDLTAAAFIGDDEDDQAAYRSSLERVQARREQELDRARIAQLAGARRAGYRTRTYLVVAAAACAIIALEMLRRLIVGLTDGEVRGFHFIYAATILLLARGADFFARRARRLSRELAEPMLPEPASPPDLTPLSDGSQLARNLEEVSDDP